MKHNNISIFIPHSGCPHTCSFCNQRTISGAQKAPEISEVEDILNKADLQIKNKSQTEIAFFGGSFTAIDMKYMKALLQAAKKHLGENGFYGIRISTRPDAIDDEILTVLKQYGVTAIELGAQSMNDRVLALNERGHNAEAVRSASKLIKSYGFELGLQMMVSLYGDDADGAVYTANEIIKLKPATVRIYPTVILNGTKLAQLYNEKIYKPIAFEEAVDVCAKLLIMFKKANINVIKLGLHASLDVEHELAGGIYHPAFKELCENKIYYDTAVKMLSEKALKSAVIYVNTKHVSKMVGQNKQNISKLKNDGYDISVKGSDMLSEYEIKIETDVKTCF